MKNQSNNEFRRLKPFKTLEELEEALSLLDHWAVPGELQKYLEILYRITAFDITGRFKVDGVVLEGVEGSLIGKYSSNVRQAALELCRSKFPNDVFVYQEGQGTRLKDGYPMAVGFLTKYIEDKVGLNWIVERTDFVKNFQSTNNCLLDNSFTLEEIKELEESALRYLESKPKKSV